MPKGSAASRFCLLRVPGAAPSPKAGGTLLLPKAGTEGLVAAATRNLLSGIKDEKLRGASKSLHGKHIRAGMLTCSDHCRWGWRRRGRKGGVQQSLKMVLSYNPTSSTCRKQRWGIKQRKRPRSQNDSRKSVKSYTIPSRSFAFLVAFPDSNIPFAFIVYPIPQSVRRTVSI